jgi:hypothetical protein
MMGLVFEEEPRIIEYIARLARRIKSSNSSISMHYISMHYVV